MKNFLKLVTPFFYGDDKTFARWGGLFLLLLSQITSSFGYFFIQWNRRFYDALEAKNGAEFFHEIQVFCILAVAFVIIASFAKYYGQQYALRWRVWMTKNSLKSWLHNPNRGALEGSDQRIQEDLMRFTFIFERIFIECFNCMLLILIYIPMLFSQTNDLLLNSWRISWLLLFAVIGYTTIGMLISAKIANPLIEYEYGNQKLEAEFRYNLVHVRDGENRELSFFNKLLENIFSNYKAIYNRQKYFNIWQRFYDQSAFLIPFGLLFSNYFAGLLTLGLLMQVRSTFSRIRNSMAYLLDHYTEITEMMAICKRLVEFYNFADIKEINLQGKPSSTATLYQPKV